MHAQAGIDTILFLMPVQSGFHPMRHFPDRFRPRGKEEDNCINFGNEMRLPESFRSEIKSL